VVGDGGSMIRSAALFKILASIKGSFVWFFTEMLVTTKSHILFLFQRKDLR